MSYYATIFLISWHSRVQDWRHICCFLSWALQCVMLQQQIWCSLEHYTDHIDLGLYVCKTSMKLSIPANYVSAENISGHLVFWHLKKLLRHLLLLQIQKASITDMQSFHAHTGSDQQLCDQAQKRLSRKAACTNCELAAVLFPCGVASQAVIYSAITY